MAGKRFFNPRRTIKLGLFLAFVVTASLIFASRSRDFASIAYPPIPESQYQDIQDAVDHCRVPDTARGFFAAMAKHESTFNPKAQSGAGAKGVLQTLSGTAYGTAIRDQIPGLDANTIFTASISYKVGVCHARYLMEEISGSTDPNNWTDTKLLKAVAVGYNAGLARGKTYYRDAYSGPISSLGYASGIVDKAMPIYNRDFDLWDAQKANKINVIDTITNDVRQGIWKAFLGQLQQ